MYLEMLYSFAKLNVPASVRVPQETNGVLKMGERRKIKGQADNLYKGICRGTGSILNFAVAQRRVRPWPEMGRGNGEFRDPAAMALALGRGIKPLSVWPRKTRPENRPWGKKSCCRPDFLTVPLTGQSWPQNERTGCRWVMLQGGGWRANLLG